MGHSSFHRTPDSVVHGLIPIMLGFAVMGTLDFSAYVKGIAQNEFGLSDGIAALIPSCCYIWFLLCGKPSSIMIRRKGKRHTAAISLALVSTAMFLICLFPHSILIFFMSICLQGIGNAFLITSLNPLVRDIVGDVHTAGTISIASSVKALSGVAMPVLLGQLSSAKIGWQSSMLITAVAGVAAAIWISVIRIDESTEDKTAECKLSELLLNRKMAVCFISGVLLISFDVCFISHLPYIIQDRLGTDIAAATSLSSVYPMAKMIFSLLGGLILLKVSAGRYLSAAISILGLSLIMLTIKQIPVLAAVAVAGASYSNLFTIVYSHAMKSFPDRTSEVSALMVMSLCGGAMALFIH